MTKTVTILKDISWYVLGKLEQFLLNLINLTVYVQSIIFYFIIFGRRGQMYCIWASSVWIWLYWSVRIFLVEL